MEWGWRQVANSWWRKHLHPGRMAALAANVKTGGFIAVLCYHGPCVRVPQTALQTALRASQEGGGELYHWDARK